MRVVRVVIRHRRCCASFEDIVHDRRTVIALHHRLNPSVNVATNRSVSLLLPVTRCSVVVVIVVIVAIVTVVVCE